MKQYNKKVFGKEHLSLGESLGNLFLIVCVYLVIMMYAFSFIYQAAKVDGTSMENTYYDGDIVYYLPNAELERGDVVIVEVTKNHEIIKRLIGLPGDRINFDVTLNNEKYIYTLTVNGKPLIETYIKEQSGNAQTFDNIYGESENSLINKKPENFATSLKGESFRKDFVLGKNEYFVLGDNRVVSQDSSYYGSFKTEQINGKVEYLSKSGKTPVIELLKQFFWPF